MSPRQTLLAPFRWSKPLGCAAFCAHSAVAAPAFVFSFLAAMMFSAPGVSAALGLLGILFFMALFFITCASSPFVLPLFSLVYAMLPCMHEFPCPPTSVALLVALIAFVLTLASSLRLMALAVRRRRHVGKRPLNFFAYSGFALAIAYAIIMEYPGSSLPHTAILLLFIMQCCMLFLPTRQPAPPAA